MGDRLGKNVADVHNSVFCSSYLKATKVHFKHGLIMKIQCPMKTEAMYVWGKPFI